MILQLIEITPSDEHEPQRDFVSRKVRRSIANPSTFAFSWANGVSLAFALVFKSRDKSWFVQISRTVMALLSMLGRAPKVSGSKHPSIGIFAPSLRTILFLLISFNRGRIQSALVLTKFRPRCELVFGGKVNLTCPFWGSSRNCKRLARVFNVISTQTSCPFKLIWTLCFTRKPWHKTQTHVR